ncbi:MAG: PHP domain-containing protein, partial [Acidobacteriota bacterium]|nr:PHP domain-containing protein [Acidobacteriota bacterium]
MTLTRRRLAALLVALVALAWFALLPPAPLTTAVLDGSPATARGAYHVHSDRSDGSGSLDEIAQAAGRAGLQFVIVTDHGDGTRAPEAPQYRHGVLVIDAVELNTASGHLVALGMPAAPYPLAGTAGDVMADVRRLGGFGIAAHPDS